MMRAIDLQGHRGARGLYPENTLEGFAGALAIGVDTLELDVAVTADDVVMVMHDPTLNPEITRTPGGAWLAGRGPPVRSLRAADLAHYDVGRIRPGSIYAAQFWEQQPHDGARIPTLAEVLRIDPVVKFDIELKTLPLQSDLTIGSAAMADAVVVVADAAGAASRIIVQSFDWRGPRRIRRTRPDVMVSWLTRTEILPRARDWWDGPEPSDFGGSVPRAVAAEGGPIWAPEYVDLTEDLIGEAHSLGLLVIPWTVNRREEMRRLLDWGVDGLISDRPDIARLVLSETGFPLPPTRPVVKAG